MSYNKPNIQRLCNYINRQPDPERFMWALLSLAGQIKRDTGTSTTRPVKSNKT